MTEGPITLEEALRRYLLVDRADQTRQTYRRFLTEFVAAIGPQRPLSLIRPEDIDAYVTAMRTRTTKYATHTRRPAVQAPLAPATIYKNVKMIKSFFRWCERSGLIEVSPAGYLVNRRPSLPLGQGKAATDDELELLLAASRFKPRDRALVLLLANSGCRAGEAAGLRIHDLELENCSALVNGKGNRRRRIYFNMETADALRAWLDVRPDKPTDYVFTPWRGNGKLSPRAISEVIRRLCKTAGLSRRLGAHSLRHRVGLKFAREHVAPRITQHYLGHTSITTTLEYYQDVDETDLRRAGALLDLRYWQPQQIKQNPAAKRQLGAG